MGGPTEETGRPFTQGGPRGENTWRLGESTMKWLKDASQAIFYAWYDGVLWRSDPWHQADIFEECPELYEPGKA
jgi:hypothetical protein